MSEVGFNKYEKSGNDDKKICIGSLLASAVLPCMLLTSSFLLVLLAVLCVEVVINDDKGILSFQGGRGVLFTRGVDSREEAVSVGSVSYSSCKIIDSGVTILGLRPSLGFARFTRFAGFAGRLMPLGSVVVVVLVIVAGMPPVVREAASGKRAITRAW